MPSLTSMTDEVGEAAATYWFSNHRFVANIHHLNFKEVIGFLRLLGPMKLSCMKELRLYIDSVGPFDRAFEKLWPLVMFMNRMPTVTPNIVVCHGSSDQAPLDRFKPYMLDAVELGRAAGRERCTRAWLRHKYQILREEALKKYA